MTSLTPLLVPGLTGLLAAFLLLRNTPLPKKGLFMAVISPALGMGMVSLTVFFSYLFRARHAKFGFLLLSFLLLFALLIACFQLASAPAARRKRETAPARRQPLDMALNLLFLAFFLFSFWHFFHYFWGYASWNIFGGWDARYMWHLKARFLFREPQYWRAMFSPEVGWHHQDYPLLIPSSIAWGWSWFDREVLIWPGILAFVFFLSLGGLVMWYLLAYVSPRSALLAGAFLFSTRAYSFWAAAFYADVPFAFYSTLSILMMTCAARLRRFELFFMAGLAGGLSAWTKNEGLLLMLVLGVLMLAVIVPDKKTSKEQKIREVLCFLAGAALPLAAVLCVKFISRIPSYFFEKKGLADYLGMAADWKRTRLIGAAFLIFKLNFEHWHGLWILFAAALAAYAARGWKRTAAYAWLPAAFALLIEAGYFAVYVISPVELSFHLGTSLIRLMLHTGAAAVIFSFESFSPGRHRSADPAKTGPH